MNHQEIIAFLQAALECSVYLSPREPGLTAAELFEAGKRVGFLDGEIGDSLRHVVTQSFGRGDQRFVPQGPTLMTWGHFVFEENPDYRNIVAFDFVVSELNMLTRAVGAGNATLDRNILVDRAFAQGIPRHDADVAITILVMCGQLAEKDAVVRFTHGGVRQLPSATQNQAGARQVMQKPARARAYPVVKDIIERRIDGRPQHAEPLDAFAEVLEKLGYGRFRLWWNQTVGELRRGDPQSSAVSVSVLAAALVEGALTFVVKHARNLGLGVFRSSDFDRDPRSWRIDELVSSAASGSESAILDIPTKARAESLIRSRQRIHAGRMLSEFPGVVPDLRPEEAREARATAELVVRRVLDWLEKYPPSETAAPKT